jgi:tetratricopeptide (TPR) repeat protein
MAHADQAVEILTAAYGPDHVDTARPRSVRASVASRRSQHEAALEEFERVLRIYRGALGANTDGVLTALNNVAVAFKNLGRLDAAERHYREALAVAESIGGPDSLGVVGPLSNLANLLMIREDYEDALVATRRVRGVVEAQLGSTHADLLSPTQTEGAILERLGRIDEAYRTYARALEISRASGFTTPRDAAAALHGMASIHYGRGERDDARRLLERAAEHLEAHPEYTAIHAGVDFDFARMLHAEDRTEEALRHARAALRGYEALGPSWEPDAQRLRRWIAERS